MPSGFVITATSTTATVVEPEARDLDPWSDGVRQVRASEIATWTRSDTWGIPYERVLALYLRSLSCRLRLSVCRPTQRQVSCRPLLVARTRDYVFVN